MIIDPFMRHTPTGDIISLWCQEGRYRIVKYNIDDQQWHLIQVGMWPFYRLYGVPGSAKGASGEYNYQLINACNPISVLDELGKVAKQYVVPRRVKNFGRNPLPKAEIIRELDISATIRALLQYSRDTQNAEIDFQLCSTLAKYKLGTKEDPHKFEIDLVPIKQW